MEAPTDPTEYVIQRGTTGIARFLELLETLKEGAAKIDFERVAKLQPEALTTFVEAFESMNITLQTYSLPVLMISIMVPQVEEEEVDGT